MDLEREEIAGAIGFGEEFEVGDEFILPFERDEFGSAVDFRAEFRKTELRVEAAPCPFDDGGHVESVEFDEVVGVHWVVGGGCLAAC